MALPLSLHALEVIKRKIVALEFRPGDVVNIRDAERYTRISAIPIREALIRLAERGLIEHVERRGFIVRRLDPRDIRGAFDYLGFVEARVLESDSNLPLGPDRMRLKLQDNLEAFAKVLRKDPKRLNEIHRLILEYESATTIRRFGEQLLDVIDKILELDAGDLEVGQRAELLIQMIDGVCVNPNMSSLKIFLIKEIARLRDASEGLYELLIHHTAGPHTGPVSTATGLPA
jgi:DNA-binding GntR family transcriptional regulator